MNDADGGPPRLLQPRDSPQVVVNRARDEPGKPTFWRQVKALCHKNWIVILRHPILNLIRCLILPLFYAAFLANARYLFNNNGRYGPGQIQPLQNLSPDLDGEKLVSYISQASEPFGSRLLQATLQTAGLEERNIKHVRLDNPEDIRRECPQNLNGFSECFAALVFTEVDPDSQTLNYTLRADFGYGTVNTADPTKDDAQARLIPLQWSVEASFIELVTGDLPDPPQIWGYTSETQHEYDARRTRYYMKSARDILVLGWVVGYILAVYHLPGRMASERANGLTELLTAQGCSDFARTVSWSLSICSAHIVVWICFGAIYGATIMPETNTGYLIVLFVVMGVMLVNWSMLVAAPFSRVPSLAAIVAAGLLILWAVVGYIVGSKAAVQIVLVLIIPPTFVVSAIRGIASFELAKRGTNLVEKSPGGDAPQIALLVMAIVVIFLYPLLALWVEKLLFSTSDRKKVRDAMDGEVPAEVAVRIADLHKEYTSRTGTWFGRKERIVAIEDLSLDIPRGEITCLLGRNGAAKSTTLYAIAKMIRVTSGLIQKQPDLKIGIAGQKDVLWDDLSCQQHVRFWSAIKGSSYNKLQANELLDRCDLDQKIKALSNSLSGGQKRKLQLACALAGGSNLLLLDEISSGLDPLSRRAIWKVVSGCREDGSATIVLTTHFLDEADYLGDHIAIMRQPGKLLAFDTPVGLKTRPGNGFVIHVEGSADPRQVLSVLQNESSSPLDYKVTPKGHLVLDTGGSDLRNVHRFIGCLQRLRKQGVDVRYQVGSTSIEDVFLDLNADSPDTEVPEVSSLDGTSTKVTEGSKFHDAGAESKPVNSMDPEASLPELKALGSQPVTLTPGQYKGKFRNFLQQSGVFFIKRLLIFRHSWFLPLIGVAVTICVMCIPLTFLMERNNTCEYVTTTEELLPMSYPIVASFNVVTPAVLSFGDSGLSTWANASLPVYNSKPDRDAWTSYLRGNMSEESLGGAAFAKTPQEQVVAFEAAPRLNKGNVIMNLFSNSVLEQARPGKARGLRIRTYFQYIPSQDFTNTGASLKWIVFFGIGIAVWPAFAALYPTQEKVSLVRANQYSNGANPFSLWTGHLLFDIPFTLFISTVVTIAFAAIRQFHGVGLLWVCLVLYGISSTLYAYVFAVFLNSALGAWAGVAIFNAITFLIYLIIYMCIMTFVKSTSAQDSIDLAHYVFSIISPVPNIVRAAMVSTNTFNLLCDGLGSYSNKPFGDINLLGAPILYMILQGLFAFAVIIWADSGYPRPAFLRHKTKAKPTPDDALDEDIIEEKRRVAQSNDALRVQELTKRYHKAPKPAVDNVSFGVDHGDTFALIGPNGAGKTTTLACIRGVEVPNAGDVVVEGNSIVKRRNKARAVLGVCPQVNAIDKDLSVSQHLWLYGRLKGVPSKALKRDIRTLLAGAGLMDKADEFATSLSGGNQRKLSLSVALIGDRPVILIDEFSSGVDPFSKREAWHSLQTLTRDRAVVMTTHSMEEVDALASRVGIIASKLLAVGSPSSLKARFRTYEIQVAANDTARVLEHLRQRGHPAHRSQDTNTRISVPNVGEDELGPLLEALEDTSNEIATGWTIHEASTETAFLSIVSEHRDRERAADDADADAAGDGRRPRGGRWRCRRRRR